MADPHDSSVPPATAGTVPRETVVGALPQPPANVRRGRYRPLVPRADAGPSTLQGSTHDRAHPRAHRQPDPTRRGRSGRATAPGSQYTYPSHPAAAPGPSRPAPSASPSPTSRSRRPPAAASAPASRRRRRHRPRARRRRCLRRPDAERRRLPARRRPPGRRVRATSVSTSTPRPARRSPPCASSASSPQVKDTLGSDDPRKKLWELASKDAEQRLRREVQLRQRHRALARRPRRRRHPARRHGGRPERRHRDPGQGRGRGQGHPDQALRVRQERSTPSCA